MGFCGKNKTNDVRWVDGLGPEGVTGAPSRREEIYQNIDSVLPQTRRMSADSARAYQAAAPTARSATGYTNKVLQGGYLNPAPQLTNAFEAARSAQDVRNQNVRNEALRNLENDLSDTRSRYARNNMGFSTAANQAQDNARALLNARLAEAENAANAQLAAREQGLVAQNYMSERQAQNQMAPVASQIASQQGNLLQAAAQAALAGDRDAAALITSLATGQGVVPGTTYKPGIVDQGLNVLSTAALANSAGFK